MNIKVGQIYQIHNKKVVITFIGQGYCNKEQVQAINKDGFTYGWSFNKAERYVGNLIASYPSWQEAINSKEFRG